MYQAKGLYLPFNEILKKAVNVPVITAGRMDDPDLAASAIPVRQDRHDRPRPAAARRPPTANKVRAGKLERIRPCLSCQEGCMGRLARFCAGLLRGEPGLRPRGRIGLTSALAEEDVMVVGGGIAGMEAARVAALRGHVVSLYEKSDRLGGVVVPGGVPDFKEDDHALLAGTSASCAN